MKVLGLNGSPRGAHSSTYHIMEHFLAGMEAEGAETALLHLQQLNINYCRGCYTCWTRTPGVCVQKDDMAAALAQYNQSDVVVFGTPLYHYSMTGMMKSFIDRTLPRFEPWLVSREEPTRQTAHPRRFDKPTSMFLVATCGFPELSNFDALVATFQKMGLSDGARILRTGAGLLDRPELQNQFSDYYALVRQAGEEVVRRGTISVELRAQLERNLLAGGNDAVRDATNAQWKHLMERR